jgi:hypothetical protein
MDRLKSEYKTHCDGNCRCCTAEVHELGDFSLKNLTWDSECPCRRAKVECGKACGCGDSCPNKQITKNRIQEFDKNVLASTCWGFDLYTRKNIFFLLSDRLDQDKKNKFIDTLIKAMNTQRFEGWNIIKACQGIITEFCTNSPLCENLGLTAEDVVQAR